MGFYKQIGTAMVLGVMSCSFFLPAAGSGIFASLMMFVLASASCLGCIAIATEIVETLVKISARSHGNASIGDSSHQYVG